MHPRATHLISTLQLRPHPEGGYFREIHRSPRQVAPDDGRQARSAITVIYFLLADGDRSRWHRVASDEIWHYHEGDPLALTLAAAPDAPDATTQPLGPVDGEAVPVLVVPAGRWQAARSAGAYTLVSCSVGPGFEFADFELDDR